MDNPGDHNSSIFLLNCGTDFSALDKIDSFKQGTCHQDTNIIIIMRPALCNVHLLDIVEISHVNC